MTTAEVLARLKGVRRSGSGWAAMCPAHEDKNPSLSISEGRAGRVLLRCQAGCSFPEIVAALGLEPADLRGTSPTTAPAPKPSTSTGTGPGRKIVATYDYRDPDGRLLFQVVRFAPKDFRQRRPDPTGRDGWAWNMAGIERVLYRWPELRRAVADGKRVFIPEGERDCDALAGVGLAATCNSGGAGKWHPSYSEALRGADVILLPDRDEPGRKHGTLVARALSGVAARVRVLELPDRAGHPVKDAADFLQAGGTREEIEHLAEAAPDWTPTDKTAATGTGTSTDAAPLEPVRAARDGAPFALTDLGNAERFAAWNRDNCRWDTARKTWRAWDGTRWAVDTALQVHRRAAETVRKIRQEAAAAPPCNTGGRDLGRELFGWAVKSESRERLAALLEVAKSQPGIAVSAEDLDGDAWALNVRNGTIDLRTGTLRPHNRADLITKLAPVEYLPGCRCERWESFLRDATGGDTELERFLQVVAGYTLTGDTAEEKLFLVYGPEASGKTTFLESLRAALGEYARTIQADLLTKQREGHGAGTATPELAGLAGARLAAGSEMEQGREVAEALAKNLTGGEPITARHLYAELFDFRPQFKLWLALNHCPRVSADDGAIWRRILRIGFEHTVPPERRDKTLKPWLRNPKGGAPAVLAWAVEGCLRWQRDGLIVPAAVTKSTETYRQESDALGPFIEDCLRFTDGMVWTPWAEIWRAYQEHAEDAGTPEKYRVAPRRLQERLRARGCACERRHEGRGWLGIRLARDGRDACDTISQSFLNEEITGKSLGNAVTTVTGVTPKLKNRDTANPRPGRNPASFTPELPASTVTDAGDALEYAARLEADGMPRAEAERLAGVTS